MPQEKRRSINYKSFVICDDPRGVVECRALRKSSIISPQKREQPNNDKIGGERKQQSTNKSLDALFEEEKKLLDAPTPSFQLNNNVINSCSNSKNGHQKHLTKDLFRRALDLPESMAMLNGLEERRFGYLEVEKPSFSLRKSLGEMKNVVRESLIRQRVITNPVFEHHFDHRKHLGSPDMPSTSSSQSSMIYSSNFGPSDYSSISSTSSSQRKKGKSSNLVYKLMGVESFPSSPVRNRESEKILNLSKPMYDIDSPRARKPQFGVSELGLKQRSIHEILETLKIKGLLKSNSVNGVVPENKWVDGHGKPPIVVMKPLSYPSLDIKEPILPKFQKDKEMLIKPSPRRGSPGEIRKLDSPKAKASVNVNQKTQKKQETVKKVSEVMKVNSSRIKEEEKKIVKSSDDLGSPDERKLTPSRIKKQKDRILISKNQNFSQQKTTSTAILDHKTPKRSKSSTQQEKKRQPVLMGVNQTSKGESKEIETVYEEKVNATSQNGSVLLTVDRLVVENFPAEKQAEACCVTEYDMEEQISLSGPQEDVPMGSRKVGNEQDSNQAILPEVTLVTTHENGILVHLDTLEEPTIDQPHSLLNIPSPSARETYSETSRKSLTPTTKLKAFILSNPSFASQAEELFDIQVSPNSVPPVINEEEPDLAYTKLLLDCANEVMDLRSLKLSQACLPLPRSYKANLQNALSLDRLLDEICNGIEDLKGYLSPSTDVLYSDTINLSIDRDLRFKSGTWEIGWRNAFSEDEVEQVIGEIDKLILGILIEEILVDFTL